VVRVPPTRSRAFQHDDAEVPEFFQRACGAGPAAPAPMIATNIFDDRGRVHGGHLFIVIPGMAPLGSGPESRDGGGA